MSIKYIVEIGNPVTHRFSSSIRNEINPSDWTYPELSGTAYQYDCRLFVPAVNSKISDSISGSTKLTNYSLHIQNGSEIFHI